VWGELLRDQIPNKAWELEVRRKDGTLALKIDCLQAFVLAGYRMIAGVVTNGCLRYLIALVPKQTIARVLRMDTPRPGEIVPTKNGDLRFSTFVNIRGVKLGRVGGLRQTATNNFRRVESVVPGLRDASDGPLRMERRIVAA
jgi:hypothetical protein